MLNRLKNLYSKNFNSRKTPLEDFKTEAFAGIIEVNTVVKASFISSFLGLPEDDYIIKTQKKYILDNDINCIIDLVLEGTNNICFIENKINSNEGYRQLERYSIVLDYFEKKGMNTHLYYCTKFTEKKQIKSHNFKQYRWFQLARHLNEPEEKDTLTKEFIQFLTSNNMAQDTTLYSTDFVVFENLQDTLNKCIEFINSVKPDFEEKFCSHIKISDKKSISQILEHGRIIYSVKGFIKGEGWSEIHYGIHLQEPVIYIEVYLDKKNENHDSLVSLVDSNKTFLIEKYDVGTSFWLEKDLSQLLNNENSELEIADWYKGAFAKMEAFINSSNLNIWNKKSG